MEFQNIIQPILNSLYKIKNPVSFLSSRKTWENEPDDVPFQVIISKISTLPYGVSKFLVDIIQPDTQRKAIRS